MYIHRPYRPPITAVNKRRSVKKRYFAGAILALLLLVGFYRYTRPVAPPTLKDTQQVSKIAPPPNVVTWPAQSQASLGTVENGLLASKAGQTARPTASTAKLITALTVLKAKPLKLGEEGPLLRITQEDINIYNDYVAANGSLAAVELGEQLSEYQMLQGLLIRSANNFADGLAIWAFGDLANYQKAAQQLVSELGMTSTTVGPDASGLDPGTVSTAEDLTRLGIAAIKNDVIRDIVQQSSVLLPVDGRGQNTNWLLGQDGVVGIKTGSTVEAGGVFVIASQYAPEGEQPLTIVGAVQGESSTYKAITESKRLTDELKPHFARRTVVKKGEKVATLITPWGKSTVLLASSDISVFGWKYTPVDIKTELTGKPPFKKGDAVGTVSAGGQTVTLTTAEDVKAPSAWWRLTTSR